jgi:aminoglycoside phosphotransferase (APT) family kinase protein
MADDGAPGRVAPAATDPGADLQPVREALAAIGYPVIDLVALDGGYGGVNLRASTPSGSLAVKVRPEPRPLQVIRAVSGALASRRVSHPDVLVPPTATSVGWMLGMRWVAGQSLVDTPVSGWSSTQAEGFGADLGRWMRQLHGIQLAHGAWRTRAERRFAEKTKLCHDAGLVVGPLARQVADLWHEYRPVLTTAPLSLIHCDLQPGNLLVHDGRFTAVIDFERARLADPLYDFVKLEEWVFPLHPNIAPSLRAAYGLDLSDRDVRARLAVVSLIEHLSAINYFHKQRKRDLVADQQQRLRRLVERG